MSIVIAGFDTRDNVGLASAKNYVARNYPGCGHVVSNDPNVVAAADHLVTPETLKKERPARRPPAKSAQKTSGKGTRKK